MKRAGMTGPCRFGSGGAYFFGCDGVLIPPVSSLALSPVQATADRLPKAKSTVSNAVRNRFMPSPFDWEIPI